MGEKKEEKEWNITYGSMSSAGLETTKLSNYDEVNK
jgi:hypothetical protein